MQKRKNIFNHKPQALILYSFILAALIGAILLKMPFSTSGHSLSFIDALFMATSAVCVTGLSVINIGKDLTITGQIIILTLIQLGGLGIMTYSLLFLILIGEKISLHAQFYLPELTQEINMKNIKHSLFFILSMALLFESLGAVLLFFNFKNYYSLPFAIYTSIFHSISAFCNAGFSLYPQSFMKFNNNIPIMCILMVLIVFGGLGFIVIYELFHIFKSRRSRTRKFRLSLHTKIALFGTFSFILAGAIIIWLLENKGLLKSMPLNLQIINSFFLSITSRTAGFNTINTASLSNPTLLLILFMMFIGGCPGSTAGGVKIHTFVSLITLIRNKIRGLSMASIFKRKIPADIIERAITILIYSSLIIFVAVFLLQLTENIKISHILVSKKEGFLDTLFEAVSAFGTVGLSTGTTQILSSGGKIILIFLMIIGRVGPLTLGIALQMRSKRRLNYEYPKEEIIVS